MQSGPDVCSIKYSWPVKRAEKRFLGSEEPRYQPGSRSLLGDPSITAALFSRHYVHAKKSLAQHIQRKNLIGVSEQRLK